ncbi:MAG TPA: cytidine deaminase [Opitutae bacterium]|nr:cytidine deaminase [Opitutae bacterium]
MAFDRQGLRSALSDLAEAEQQLLLEQLHAVHFSGCLTATARPAIELAPQLVELAAQFSIAPISGFNVGAVAVGTSGQLYLGANMEFVGAPLSASLHAEQSAVLNAWGHGERAILALAISAAPCGHCRQFLWELSNAATLAISVAHTRTELGTLFPMPFGAARQPGHGLLDSPTIPLESLDPLGGELAQRALHAAQRSYVPYTQDAEAFAVECANGQRFSGRAAESIAFNPSIPAAIGALNQRNLSSSRDDSIVACTHATLANGHHSNRELTATLLRGVSQAAIETVRIRTS